MHNIQPWRFGLVDGCLEVRADPQRRLPVADPAGRAVRVACGSATCNAQLALAVSRIVTEVTLRPDPEQPHLMARLRPTASRPPTARESELYAALPHRHSNRAHFLDKPVPADVRARLRTAARDSGAWLELLVGRGPLTVVAEIVWAADGALRRDAAYRAEQRAWSGRAGGADGVPASAAAASRGATGLLPMRDFGTSGSSDADREASPARPAALERGYDADPLVAVLGTAGDTAHDQIVAGIALQRVLLAATDAGLSASMLSQAIEVPAAREQLRIGLGRYGMPQMVLRVGYGEPAVPSPRRPAVDVIDR